MTRYRKLAGLIAVLLLSACGLLPEQPSVNEAFPRHAVPVDERIAPMALDIPLAQRVAIPTEAPPPAPTSERLFSFVVANMDVRDALQHFAREYGLNLVIDDSVSGPIDVEFHDLPLRDAMSLMIDAGGFYWRPEGSLIRVSAWETRQFEIDYLRLQRSGQGSSTAKVSSGGGNDSGGSSTQGNNDAGEAGSVLISHQDTVNFWGELDEQVRSLLSADGTLVFSQLAGTVLVRDRHPNVEAVGRYIDMMSRAIHRQVDIEVKMLEVTLDDDHAFGVNWSRLLQTLDPGDNFNVLLDGQITSPGGGFDAIPQVLELDFSRLASNGDVKVAALVSALKEQGEVEVVSQPHVRTLNNQTALIKVGTDRTFFRREQQTDSTSAGSVTTATDVPQVVTEGVVLSITPQIAGDGWIMMDVSPVVTRVSSVATVTNDNGVVQSSAPNLDVAQVSSLVRARSGDTIVIGGLIQTRSAKVQRSVPVLERLGPLGRIFGGSYQATQKKELVMVLTPNVVDL